MSARVLWECARELRWNERRTAASRNNRQKDKHPHTSTTLSIRGRALPQTSSLSPRLTPRLTAWTSTRTKMDPGFSGDAGLDLSARVRGPHLAFLHRSYGWRRKVSWRWIKGHAGVRLRQKRSSVFTCFSATFVNAVGERLNKDM